MRTWLAAAAIALAAAPARADLVASARDGDLAEVQAAIRDRADLNVRNEDVMTPLMFAAFRSRDKAARALIGAGADVNAKTRQGMTALMYAGIRGRAAVAGELIKAGAEINARDESGMTALLCAVMFERAGLKQIEMLIRAGADVDAKGPPRGMTALMYAAGHDKTDIARLLTKSGAKVDAQQEDGGWTALMRAAVSGSAGMARLLIEAGADPTLRDGQGRTALTLAQEHKHPGVVRIIEEAARAPRR